MKKENFTTEKFAEYYAKAQMLMGTASPQTISYYLRRQSKKEQLELDNLEAKNALLREQAQKIQDERDRENLYQRAIDAMREYSGHSDD